MERRTSVPSELAPRSSVDVSTVKGRERFIDTFNQTEAGFVPLQSRSSPLRGEHLLEMCHLI